MKLREDMLGRVENDDDQNILHMYEILEEQIKNIFLNGSSKVSFPCPRLQK